MKILIFYISFCISLQLTSRAEATLARVGSQWADPNNIPVCWELDPPGNSNSLEYRKDWIREAIDLTWGTAGFRFIGWGNCNAASTGIRITTSGTHGGAWTAAIGKSLNGISNGVEASLSINRSEIDSLPQDDLRKQILLNCFESEEKIKNCITYSAVHEFGHALGLEHEQNRSTVVSPCDRDVPFTPMLDNFSGTQGRVTFGPYDSQSIMNYCRKLDPNITPTLSKLDREGVMAFYRGDNGVQEIGRPLLKINQGAFDNATTLLPNEKVSLTVVFPYVPDSTRLSDPRGALTWYTGSISSEVVSCGEWSNDPTYPLGKLSVCSWLPANHLIGSKVNFLWDKKFVNFAEVQTAITHFANLQNAKVGQPFEVEIGITLVPGSISPTISVTGKYYSSNESVVFTIPDCQKVSDSEITCKSRTIAPLSAKGYVFLTGKIYLQGKPLSDILGSMLVQ